MPKTKAISNEQIITALLANGTIKAAAEAAGTTPRTVYERMRDSDFRQEYAAAKNDIIRGAVFLVNQKLTEAVTTVAEIMNDKDVNPATRLQAAQTILNNAGKFAERLTTDERESLLTGRPIEDALLL